MKAAAAWSAMVRLARVGPAGGLAASVVEETALALGAEEVALWLGTRDFWRCSARWSRAGRVRSCRRAHVPACILHDATSIVRLPAGRSAHEFLAGSGPGWLLVAPLEGRRGCLVARLRGGARPQAARGVLAAMAALTQTALRTRERQRRLRRLSVTDELTGAMNFRGLRRTLRAHVKRAGASGARFSILMVDLDRLKEYNERHGHLSGSDLLRRVGAILVKSVRPGDIVTKYGGDEFVLILPRTEAGLAGAIGERVRRAVSSCAFPCAARGAITLSVGIAQFPEDGETAQALLRAADRALFTAKRQGRNRVSVASRAA
jgi:diguanylate cyclase (GGDEF)-like protein